MPFTNLSYDLVPPRNGWTITPFGKFFDFDQWKWSIIGQTRTTLPDEGHITMETSVFGRVCEMGTCNTRSVFAVSEVWKGCDGVPMSGKEIDDCGVCTHRDNLALKPYSPMYPNGTCSGCDGIPNSGREKTCSGHGQCHYHFEDFPLEGRMNVFIPEKSNCVCAEAYFGDNCQILCP